MSFFESMCRATGYKPKTIFWRDFANSEGRGIRAVQETYELIMDEWSYNYIYLTELVLVLNWNIWYWYGIGSKAAKDFVELYTELFEKTSEYALDHLIGDELDYYLRTVD